MMHFTCDHCGKELTPGEDQRFVVRIEACAAEDSQDLTEADLEEGHLQAVSEMLQEMEDEGLQFDEPAKTFRYDLCGECHKRFIHDPLGKEHLSKLYFSKN
ncbi:MAG: hypothetical protein L0Y72_30840 [Gemmataceae bacterium]|nr:hypothetical protein [Gemmataceae bacterium]MCI0743446.1 hypothetical protein [Gemmataceae bacterium]